MTPTPGGTPGQPPTGGAGGTPPAAGAGGAPAAGAGGAPAAGAGGGPPGPATDEALYSEDFEGKTSLDPGVWENSVVGGNEMGISVDTAQGHDSNSSLKVSHTNFHTMAALVDPNLFPLPNNSAFVRVWMKIGSEIPSGHGTFIEAGAKENDKNEIRIGVNLNVMDVNYWPGDWEQRTESLNWTKDEWHCVEFQIDGLAHELRVWYDDAPQESLTVTDWTGMPGNHTTPETEWVPTLESIRFGGELQSVDVWFDDIVVSSSKIGCD